MIVCSGLYSAMMSYWLAESGPGILKRRQHLIPICTCNGLFTVLYHSTHGTFITKHMVKNHNKIPGRPTPPQNSLGKFIEEDFRLNNVH